MCNHRFHPRALAAEGRCDLRALDGMGRVGTAFGHALAAARGRGRCNAAANVACGAPSDVTRDGRDVTVLRHWRGTCSAQRTMRGKTGQPPALAVLAWGRRVGERRPLPRAVIACVFCPLAYAPCPIPRNYVAAPRMGRAIARPASERFCRYTIMPSILRPPLARAHRQGAKACVLATGRPTQSGVGGVVP